MLTQIDHVAIAVHDLDAAVSHYEQIYGATVSHTETIEPDGVREALIKVGESYVQLISPTNDDSPVARFLKQRGEGIHHIGYRVPDCALALQTAIAGGATAIDSKPRPGSRGTTIAFIHPKGNLGTLIELVQE